MNGQNDLYHYLHNPDEYAKQKEYIKKKKLLYGNELRLQIEENNRIKQNQMANPKKRLKFPKLANNNKNSFCLQNYNEISKDNNDNNNYSELNNNFNNINNQNFLKTLTQNFPNILNQKQINDNNNINDINTNKINDQFLNGNDLNIQRIFNNFVENQISAIDDYISNVDKIVNINKQNGLDIKNNDSNDINDVNENNEIKNYDIYYNKNNESINQLKKMIDKERKKVINNINSEKEKLKNKLGYFPEEDNYNKRIEELFNKIMNKKIAKYTSISPRKNNIINKDNPDLNENNLNINNNSEKNLNNNSDNVNNNDKDNNNSNNFENNSNNILDFSCNLNENNNNNAKNKNIDSNKDNQNSFMDNRTNINIKENTSNNGTLLKPSKNKFLNIETNNQKYDFAFKNNSFNNNSEANKSFKSEEVKNDNLEDKSMSNSNSNPKEEDKNDDDEDLLNNSKNNEEKNKKSFILSKKDNIMDIFSRNEKNRIKKFSEGCKNNDNKKYKEIKVRKNMSKKTFTLPVNQNFKNIKNISKDIKFKSLKTLKNNIVTQKSFFRTRSKSYKGKKVNIKLKKKNDGNSNNQIDNIMSDYYNRNNSKNLSYSYNDLNLKNKLNVEKKINISHNNDNIKEKRNKISRKKKVSIQNEENSGMIGNTEPNTAFANRSNRSIINLENRYNIFQKRSSSYAQNQNNKMYPLDNVEYRQSKTMNALRKRSESSFFTGMNVFNNQFLPNIMFDRGGNDRDDDRLYRMIKNFEESVKERIRIDEGKEIKQIHRVSNIYLNNNINSNMNNNILFRNNTKNFGEVELIPKKYIYRCKKIIYPEIESEKIKERERLLFGKSKIN